tara:strand:+ start:806 stop:1051 length:246 start_codon:yes stop_codon:yes gene_type:complete
MPKVEFIYYGKDGVDEKKSKQLKKMIMGDLKIIDDGTLDTVVLHTLTGTEHRFSQEYVSQFTDLEDFMDSAEKEIEAELWD